MIRIYKDVRGRPPYIVASTIGIEEPNVGPPAAAPLGSPEVRRCQ